MTSETGNVRPLSTTLDGVWRVLSDLRTTLVLIVSAPVIAAVSTRSGAGLDTPALRLLLALLAFNLLLQLALQVERATRLWSPRYPPPAAGSVVQLDFPIGEDALRTSAGAVWQGAFSHVLAADPPTMALYGARRRRGIIGPLMAIAAALLLLAGLWLNATLGWSEYDLMLTGGAAKSLRQLAGASLMLEDSAASTAQATIALIRPSGEPQRIWVTPGRPARIGALWLLASEGGPTLEASGRDGAGQPLALLPAEPGAEPRHALSLPFPPTQAEQAFSVPAAGLVLRAVSYASLPERGMENPVLLVEAYREGDAAPVADALVADVAELTLDGATYDLRRGRYLDVRVGYLPGWPLLVAGATLTAVGLLLSLFLGAREGWLDGSDSTVRTAGGLTPRRDARSLADRLRAESAPASNQQGDR